MSDLFYDQAIIMIFLAFLIVFIPIVIAALGTLSIPLNDFEASRLVSLCKYTSLVQLFIGDGGSLKPMCPVLPIPSIWRSIPPLSAIFFS